MTAELIASENTKQVMLDMTRQRIIEYVQNTPLLYSQMQKCYKQ